LKQLVEEGYRIVVFTNQGGVSEGHTKIDHLKKKFNAISEKAGVPMLFMGATDGD
jgi:histidinol phosphatase-like enzyme